MSENTDSRAPMTLAMARVVLGNLGNVTEEELEQAALAFQFAAFCCRVEAARRSKRQQELELAQRLARTPCLHLKWHDTHHAGRLCDDCDEELTP